MKSNEIPAFLDYCKKYIIDKMNDRRGQKIEYGLADTLTDADRMDGCVISWTTEAERHINEWSWDAGDYLDYEMKEFGKYRANPFHNPCKFLMFMVTEAVSVILSRCQFIEDYDNNDYILTDEVIETITAQVEEQTNEDLFQH